MDPFQFFSSFGRRISLCIICLFFCKSERKTESKTDMAMRSEAGRLLTYQAAVLKGEGKRFTKEAAMAKLFCSEHAMLTTTKALQMFGGYGYTKDYPLERMMRDAKITEIYEGTSEIQRVVISGNIGL